MIILFLKRWKAYVEKNIYVQDIGFDSVIADAIELICLFPPSHPPTRTEPKKAVAFATTS